jgi:hypothetical protein
VKNGCGQNDAKRERIMGTLRPHCSRSDLFACVVFFAIYMPHRAFILECSGEQSIYFECFVAKHLPTLYSTLSFFDGEIRPSHATRSDMCQKRKLVHKH